MYRASKVLKKASEMHVALGIPHRLGLPWSAMIYLGVPWSVILCLSLLWSALVCLDLSWSVQENHRMVLNAQTNKWIGLDGWMGWKSLNASLLRASLIVKC